MDAFQFMIIWGLAAAGMITLVRTPYDLLGMMTPQAKRVAANMFLVGAGVAMAGGIGLVINHTWYA
jgi:hypothetical protein